MVAPGGEVGFGAALELFPPPQPDINAKSNVSKIETAE
jgi:hypothetical protein